MDKTEYIDKNDVENFLKIYNRLTNGTIKTIEYDYFHKNIAISFENKDLYEEKVLTLDFEAVRHYEHNALWSTKVNTYEDFTFFKEGSEDLVCFSSNYENPDIAPYLYIICKHVSYKIEDKIAK